MTRAGLPHLSCFFPPSLPGPFSISFTQKGFVSNFSGKAALPDASPFLEAPEPALHTCFQPLGVLSLGDPWTSTVTHVICERRSHPLSSSFVNGPAQQPTPPPPSFPWSPWTSTTQCLFLTLESKGPLNQHKARVTCETRPRLLLLFCEWTRCPLWRWTDGPAPDGRASRVRTLDLKNNKYASLA